MEVKQITISDQIIKNMRIQGRKMNWLIEQLGISRRTFYIRLNTNNWKFEEMVILKKLGIL